MIDPRTLKVGQKVIWTDPAEIYEPTEEHSSGVWTVGKTGLEGVDHSEFDAEDLEEVIVFLTNEADGEAEVWAKELTLIQV